jgi:hypothetical protein
MDTEDKSTALVVRNAKDLNNALVANSDKCHILTPFTQLMMKDDQFPEWIKPSLRTIYVSARYDEKTKTYPDGEVYESWEKRGEVALTKLALDKLALVAGIEWVQCRRVDDTLDPNKATYYAEGRILLSDGTHHTEPSSKSINLNDGSPEAEVMKNKPAQLAGARKNISALAESKAKNRVIRTLLGLKQSYKPDELNKPFMIVKIIPDMNHPDIRRMVQAQMLGLEKYLFVQPEQREEQMPGILPQGTHGLDLPEPPGGKPSQITGNTGTAPIDVSATDVTNGDPFEKTKEEKIKGIESLYFTKTKTGFRDPNKPLLSNLTDSEIDQLLKYMQDQPTVRKPVEDFV